MSTTDNYGQGIEIAALTDAPNAEVLARNIVNKIVPQTIMQFASASERNATLTGPTAPVAGMMTWLQDIERMELYDGTVWVAVASGQTVWTPFELNTSYSTVPEDNNELGIPEYRVVNLFGERALMIRGGVGITYDASNAPVGGPVVNRTPLPSAIRPTGRRSVPVTCSTVNSVANSMKLDLDVDGTLNIVGNGGAENRPPWISLNAICSL